MSEELDVKEEIIEGIPGIPVDDQPPPEPEPDTNQPAPEPEPPPDHPRFKEIYGKMKEYERQLENNKITMQEFRQHNEALQNAITGFEDEFSEANRPDPIEDPDKYDKWMAKKVKRDIEKESRQKADPNAMRSDQVPGVQDVMVKNGLDPRDAKILIQESVAAFQVPDYYESIDIVKEQMKTDPILRRDILSADNPPLAAYKYAEALKAKNEQHHQTITDQGRVEGSSESAPAPVKGELTADEKRTAAMLGVPEEKYLAQKIYIQGGGK